MVNPMNSERIPLWKRLGQSMPFVDAGDCSHLEVHHIGRNDTKEGPIDWFNCMHCGTSKSDRSLEFTNYDFTGRLYVDRGMVSPVYRHTFFDDFDLKDQDCCSHEKMFMVGESHNNDHEHGTDLHIYCPSCSNRFLDSDSKSRLYVPEMVVKDPRGKSRIVYQKIPLE